MPFEMAQLKKWIMLLQLACIFIIIMRRCEIRIPVVKSYLCKGPTENDLATINRTKIYGKWKYGLKYKPSCGKIVKNVCCELDSRRMHFVFKNEEMNRIDVLQSFKRKIIGKNMTFFGDSLQRNLIGAMIEVLGDWYGIERLERNENNQRANWFSVKVNRNKTYLSLLEFYTFLIRKCEGIYEKRYIVNRDMIQMALKTSDIMVMNLGLHYNKCTVAQYKDSLVELAKIMKLEMKEHPYKQVICRNTLPQHFQAVNGSFYFEGFDKSLQCSRKPNNLHHWTNKHLEEICKAYGFKYLDSFPIFADRWDLHEPWRIPPDCSHYCFTPELVIPEIAMLNELLV